MRLGLIRDFQEINYPKKQTTPDAEKPVRWAGSPTCSRSVSPWEKQLARHRERRNREDFCFGIFLFGSPLEVV